MAAAMFGPYRLDGLLGRGGMGDVWRAYDTEQDRVVALKVLPPDLGRDEEYRARFRREARIAAQLNDPHIVPIHRHGEIDGRMYLDMRLVDGEDLARVLASSGPLPAAEAVAVVEQVAAALDTAHAENLVHRDIKPSNVLLTRPRRPGGQRFAYLGDFGIARPLLDSPSGPLTRSGTTVGTLAYMAPERFLDRPIDARADVYSLACLLHECLTGRKPFPGTELPALMHGHLSDPPPRPSEHPGVPAALDTVVARGMAKDPADRYATAGDLAAAARAALATPPVPADISLPPHGSGPDPRTVPAPAAVRPRVDPPPHAPAPWWPAAPAPQPGPGTPPLQPAHRLPPDVPAVPHPTPARPAQAVVVTARRGRPLVELVDLLAAASVSVVAVALVQQLAPALGLLLGGVWSVLAAGLRHWAQGGRPGSARMLTACNAGWLGASLLIDHRVYGDEADLARTVPLVLAALACCLALLLLVIAVWTRVSRPSVDRGRFVDAADVCLAALPLVVLVRADVYAILACVVAVPLAVLRLRVLRVRPHRPAPVAALFGPAVALGLFFWAIEVYFGATGYRAVHLWPVLTPLAASCALAAVILLVVALARQGRASRRLQAGS